VSSKLRYGMCGYECRRTQVSQVVSRAQSRWKGYERESGERWGDDVGVVAGEECMRRGEDVHLITIHNALLLLCTLPPAQPSVWPSRTLPSFLISSYSSECVRRSRVWYRASLSVPALMVFRTTKRSGRTRGGGYDLVLAFLWLWEFAFHGGLGKWR
jgi:hypothetical protein